MLTWNQVHSRKRSFDGKFYNDTYLPWRAKIPGGWLVRQQFDEGVAMTFVPDPNHVWDGSSLDDV